MTNLWIGIPEEAEPRVARLKNAPPLPLPADAPILRAMPPQVGATEEVFAVPICDAAAFRVHTVL